MQKNRFKKGMSLFLAGVMAFSSSSIVLANDAVEAYGRVTVAPEIAPMATAQIAPLNIVQPFAVELIIAHATAVGAIGAWDATTDWSVGNVANHQTALMAAITAALDDPAITVGNMGAAGRHDATIVSEAQFDALLTLTMDIDGELTTVLVDVNLTRPMIPWDEAAWIASRNLVQRPGRSDLERNMVTLVEGFGPRVWGTQNEHDAGRFVEGYFNDVLGNDWDVEFVTHTRQSFGSANTVGFAEISFANGQNIYGRVHPLAAATHAQHPSWNAITGATLVDLGTYPDLAIPAGTAGSVVGVVRYVGRFGVAHSQDLYHLAEIADGLSDNDVTVEAIVVSKVGNENLRAMLPGQSQNHWLGATLINYAGMTAANVTRQPAIPIISTSDMLVENMLSRAGQMQSIERIVRSEAYGVVATRPASNPADPDAIIVVSAHLDSVVPSPGAADNASGTAILMEVARHFANVDFGNTEVILVASGAHENGGAMPVAYVAQSIVDRGLAGRAINFNMDIAMSASPRADGERINAVSMDIPEAMFNGTGAWAGRGSQFNLPAFLVVDDATSVNWVNTIDNVRVFPFNGSDHVQFANRGITAASMIMVCDEENDLEIGYHNSRDNLDFNYCYDRLRTSTNLMINAIERALDEEITMVARFAEDIETGEIVLVNADRLFNIYDTITATRGTQTLVFRPNVTRIAVESFGLITNVMARGIGTADHGNAVRNAQLNTLTQPKAVAIDDTMIDILTIARQALENWADDNNWAAGGIAGHLSAIIEAIEDDLEEANFDDVIVTSRGAAGRHPATIVSQGQFDGILSLVFDGMSIDLDINLTSPAIPWDETAWIASRNLVQRPGRSDLERNMVTLVEGFGPRVWGTQNERNAGLFVESYFNEVLGNDWDVEFVTHTRQSFGLQNTVGFAEISFANGQNIYGRVHPLAAATHEQHPSWNAITGATLVDLGTYPYLAIPPGTTGSVVGVVRYVGRFGAAHSQDLYHLAEVASELSGGGVTVEAIVVSVVGNPNLAAMLPGQSQNHWLGATLINYAGMTAATVDRQPAIPIISTSDMLVENMLGRANDMTSVARIVRSEAYGVVATRPASNPEDPDAIIVVSAHLDSVVPSPGAADNASGTAILMEVARHFAGVDFGNTEVILVASGSHEGGGAMPVAYVAQSIVDRGLAGRAINFNMDIAMSASPRADGEQINAVSMDIPLAMWNGTGPWVGRGSHFNLPAFLVVDDATSVNWVNTIDNVRVFPFNGSDHVQFANRGITAASMIMVDDEENDLEIGYHNSRDNLDFNYCYDRLRTSVNLMINAIERAVESNVAMVARIEADEAEGTLTLINANQLFSIYDTISGQMTVPGGNVINFEFSSTAETVPVADFGPISNVFGRGAGTADNLNSARAADIGGLVQPKAFTFDLFAYTVTAEAEWSVGIVTEGEQVILTILAIATGDSSDAVILEGFRVYRSDEATGANMTFVYGDDLVNGEGTFVLDQATMQDDGYYFVIIEYSIADIQQRMLSRVAA